MAVLDEILHLQRHLHDEVRSSKSVRRQERQAAWPSTPISEAELILYQRKRHHGYVAGSYGPTASSPSLVWIGSPC